MMVTYYVGVDVGTSSARAALLDNNGKIIAVAEEELTINEPEPDFYEQSSDEIWLKCCALIKSVTKDVKKEEVHGIGFDATCSLVVLDANQLPVKISQTALGSIGTCYNVIMWMDHRAKEQADVINVDGHEVLKYVGGKMSLEMQPPKLLWLKQKNPTCWKRAAHFFDLPDFLTFKATGSYSRSLCSLTCKWGYTAANGWHKDFWTRIGLEEVTEHDFEKLGNKVTYPGHPVGNGLSDIAAADMNLCSETPVGTSLIDAHCGGIGTIGADLGVFKHQEIRNVDITQRISLICGTSSCHMTVSEKAIFVPGVWGPYFSAMIPNLWLNEGGQSATGKLIDHIIQSHAAYPELQMMSTKRKQHPHICLNELLKNLATSSGVSQPDLMTENLHVWPDFHGNRSPVADSSLCGAICGLTLDNSLESLAKLYVATIQSLASGSLHIVDAMEGAGHSIDTVFMCGGLSKNPLFVQVHANVLGRPVILGKESEAVLLGAGILGACASGDFASLSEAMKAMSRAGECVLPDRNLGDFYKKKHRVFLAMLSHQLEYRKLMA